jgi:hypothetical protein
LPIVAGPHRTRGGSPAHPSPSLPRPRRRTLRAPLREPRSPPNRRRELAQGELSATIRRIARRLEPPAHHAANHVEGGRDVMQAGAARGFVLPMARASGRHEGGRLFEAHPAGPEATRRGSARPVSRIRQSSQAAASMLKLPQARVKRRRA